MSWSCRWLSSGFSTTRPGRSCLPAWHWPHMPSDSPPSAAGAPRSPFYSVLFAAWTGGVFASQWLLLTGGERVGALLFVLLAGGVLAGALVRSKDEQQAIRRWAPGIVWFAVFVCALVLWQALQVQEARFIDN